MAKNLFLNLQSGKTYKYEELKELWDKTKTKPNDFNYGFLSSIFAMDSDEHNYSESIFGEIAKLDKNESISINDIENLANTDNTTDSKVKVLTLNDYDDIYRAVGFEEYDKAYSNGDPKPMSKVMEFKNERDNAKLNPFYVNSDGKEYINEKQAKKIVQEKIQKSKDKIIQYASEHPEDSKIQEYAKLLKEIKLNEEKKDNFVAEEKFTNGKDGLFFYYNHPEYYENEEVTTAIMLHELEHARNKDNLSSVAEETVAETYAVETAKKIHNVDNIYGDDKAHLEEFSTRYNNSLPENSPGYNGMPEGLGFSIPGEIKSIEKEPNKYVIKSVKKDTEYNLTVNLDDNGVPTEATYEKKEVICNSTLITTKEIGSYDKATRTFTKLNKESNQVIKN